MEYVDSSDTMTEVDCREADPLPASIIPALFESNPLPMWIYDLDTLQFLSVNQSAVVHYGYSRAEFLSMTIADIRPSQDVAALLANIEKVNNRLDRAGVWHHLRKDGSLIFVEITSHPIDFLEKRAELVIAYDVSDRIAAEANLHNIGAARETYRRYFPNSY